MKNSDDSGVEQAHRFAEEYRKFQGPRLVRCPESGEVANIDLDAAHAAGTVDSGTPRLRVARCALWREGDVCEQECLAGVTPEWARDHALLLRRDSSAKTRDWDEV